MPLVGSTEAPELFIDGYHGVAIQKGVAKLNLYSIAFDADTNHHERRVVLRLAVPLGTLVGMHEALGDLINNLEREGFLKRVEGAPDAEKSK